MRLRKSCWRVYRITGWIGEGRIGIKNEIEGVMLEVIQDNELTAGVFRQDDRCWRYKQCQMCNQSS